MSAPRGFYWLQHPILGGLARPWEREDFEWLRDNGIQILLTLTEDPLRRDLINDTGLMSVHEPIDDFAAPGAEQLDRCLAVIERAHEQKMGVAVHCAAGRGRTGTILAAWLVAQGGLSANDAIRRIRELRPGSIESVDQEEAIRAFERRRRGTS